MNLWLNDLIFVSFDIQEFEWEDAIKYISSNDIIWLRTEYEFTKVYNSKKYKKEENKNNSKIQKVLKKLKKGNYFWNKK